MKEINKIICAGFVLLFLSCVCFSQKKDVSGWQDARWEMNEQELVGALGSKLEKLSKRAVYNGLYVDYVISDYEIEGDKYDVYFQMDSRTNRLSQILIKYKQDKSDISLESKFLHLETFLTREYGDAGDKIERKDDTYLFLIRLWKFKTTSIELSHRWSSQSQNLLFAVRFFPSQPTYGVGSGEGLGNGSGTGNGDGNSTPTPGKTDGDTQGIKILSKAEAAYTAKAKQARVEGTVMLRVTFLANGKIGNITPISGLPLGLTESAMEAARKIVFEPAKRNGVPYSVIKTLAYTFTLF
jgi:TonB family protein